MQAMMAQRKRVGIPGLVTSPIDTRVSMILEARDSPEKR